MSPSLAGSLLVYRLSVQAYLASDISLPRTPKLCLAGPSVDAHAPGHSLHAVGIWNVGRFRQPRLPLTTEQVHVRTLTTVFVTPCMPSASDKIFLILRSLPHASGFGAGSESSSPSDLIRVIFTMSAAIVHDDARTASGHCLDTVG